MAGRPRGSSPNNKDEMTAAWESIASRNEGNWIDLGWNLKGESARLVNRVCEWKGDERKQSDV